MGFASSVERHECLLGMRNVRNCGPEATRISFVREQMRHPRTQRAAIKNHNPPLSSTPTLYKEAQSFAYHNSEGKKEKDEAKMCNTESQNP